METERKKMLCAVDIGNSTITMGLFREIDIEPSFVFTTPYEKSHSVQEIVQEIGSITQGIDSDESVTCSAISSVVPEITPAVSNALHKVLGINPLEINTNLALNITTSYKKPENLGIDRLSAASGAIEIAGKNCIIADLGTATTFTVLQEGILTGGVIAPGMMSSLKSLSKSTSRLMKIQLTGPTPIPADDTEEAIRSGLFHGWAAMTEGLYGKIARNFREKPKFILTGGMGSLLSPYIETEHIMDRYLLLKGIRIISSLNC